MQKSQRGLMRSAKQQKRKQKLFALCNNNNPINCRQSPSLPLLEPAFWSLLTVGDSAWEASPPTTLTRRLGAGLMCHPSPGLELMGERAPRKKKKKKKASCPYWSLRASNGYMGWNLGRVRFAFQTGSEFRTGKINTSKIEIMHVKGRSAAFVSWL